MNETQIECHANWYVVWYWEDEKHFVNKKFLDYEDALEFYKDVNMSNYVVVINPGTDEEEIVFETTNYFLALKVADHYGNNADVMKLLNDGRLTTEY